LKTNLPSLTALRGIAAILVMLFHIDVIIFYRELGSLIPHKVSGIITKGYLWVDFFFLLSGFIINHVYGKILSADFMNWKTAKHFLWARFSRIYPLHIFTLTLLILFAIIFPLISPKVVDGSWTTFFAWSAIWDNLVLINAMNQHNYLSWNIVSWSIGAEWWTYIAAIFILPLVQRKKIIQNLIILLLAITAICLLVFHKKNLDITYDYGFIRCIADFLIGTILYQLFLNRIGKKWLQSNSIFLILIILLLLMFHYQWNDLLTLPIFCCLILSSVYNEGLIKENLEKRIPKYLGEISYSIYMMHGFWFMVFWYCLPYLKSNYGIGELNVWMKLGYLILFIAITLISSHYTYKYIEIKCRFKLRQWVNIER
jgi:peptidoglycan/LPS O-acetylase OafA/YrhL